MDSPQTLITRVNLDGVISPLTVLLHLFFRQMRLVFGGFFFFCKRALIDVNLIAGNLELLVLSVNVNVLSASSDNIIAEVMFAFSLHSILIENKTNAFLSHFRIRMKCR